MTLTLRWTHVASKCLPYTVEPLTEGPTSWWEGFCTTNPTMLRLPGDERIYLGYRAAGNATSYYDGYNMIWGSSLGLAILDGTGSKVLHRFPLPIVRREPDHPLPQDKEGYERYIAKHGQAECLLHDFRFWLHGERLYLIYHSAGLNRCLDCVGWMPVDSFRQRIEQSLLVLGRNPMPELDVWRRLWWRDAWEPAGVNGTPYIYASSVNKNDIVFFERADGSLRMSHRPYPDIAWLDVGSATHATATEDGITRYGNIERSIRPGSFDNAHIGPNGAPTPANIGDTQVYIEITHGVHDGAIAKAERDEWDLIYMPYLRVSDRATGEELYYSADPIIDYDDTWRDYVEDGAWIRRLDHLQGVMFPGGQLPVTPGRNGLDDEFMFFTGVGDTAVARATFTLRQLLPADVVRDIELRPEHQQHKLTIQPMRHLLGEASGWQWQLSNHASGQRLLITRTLERNGQSETDDAHVLTRPGFYDADALCLSRHNPIPVAGLGWVVFYRGARWLSENGQKRTQFGVGVLLLDPENPERVLYRSEAPLAGTETDVDGWQSPDQAGEVGPEPLRNPLGVIPAKVQQEWLRILDLIARGKRERSHHTRWLLQKSGRLD